MCAGNGIQAGSRAGEQTRIDDDDSGYDSAAEREFRDSNDVATGRALQQPRTIEE